MIKLAGIVIFIAILCLMIFALFGLFVFVKTLVTPMKAPADTSNRIAHLRLVWFAITRPELFVDFFPDLTRDEKDNLKES
ncbi:MAG: hypothetical protein ACSHWN_04795 [Methylophilaceae bacterium]